LVALLPMMLLCASGGLAQKHGAKPETGTIGSITSITPQSEPTVFGQVVTLDVDVFTSSGDVEPTGTVTFYYEEYPLGTVTLVDGAAALAVAMAGLPLGTYEVTAAYKVVLWRRLRGSKTLACFR
jgi:hypothetical protein